MIDTAGLAVVWNSKTSQVLATKIQGWSFACKDQQHLLLCLQQSPPMDRNDRSSVQGNPAFLAPGNVRFRLLSAGQKENEEAEDALVPVKALQGSLGNSQRGTRGQQCQSHPALLS